MPARSKADIVRLRINDAAHLPKYHVVLVALLALIGISLRRFPTSPWTSVEEPRYAWFVLEATRIASHASAWSGCVDPEKIGIFIGTTGERVSLAQIAKVAHEARGETGDILPNDFVRVFGRKMEGR